MSFPSYDAPSAGCGINAMFSITQEYQHEQATNGGMVYRDVDVQWCMGRER